MQIPIYILVLDYILGVIMWTLIGRSAMGLFQKEDSEFFFMKAFVKFTNPVISVFRLITPSFIIRPMVPLYVAWFFYMFRFYFMPYALGYSVMGMLSFPLESEITQALVALFSKSH
jgi:sorbitol-specific phosphotransferase system component IIC|tara:strand:+ start:3285 stop:3632 length:348 start_codon:yes stop_codon:yes gene_type:complete